VLDVTVRRALASSSSGQIDLIAYSLGGAVAANWAATSGRQDGLLRHVHSIVTLDSPVRGVRALALLPLLNIVFSGRVWADLQPQSAAIRHITAFGNPWWRRTGHLHTVANRNDRLVPPTDALLGDEHVVSDPICPVDFGFLRSCHGAVLGDLPMAGTIACHWIVSGNPCAPTPTPSSTPTATTVPTVTPATPTSVPTETPSPTPEVTAIPTVTASATATPTVG
jgi:pimeloyl-ACP methyl ester carboxylesterase